MVSSTQFIVLKDTVCFTFALDIEDPAIVSSNELPRSNKEPLDFYLLKTSSLCDSEVEHRPFNQRAAGSIPHQA